MSQAKVETNTLRAGDVVRLKPVKVGFVYTDGSFDLDESEHASDGICTFELEMVEEIVSRAYPLEEIERLKAENAELRAKLEQALQDEQGFPPLLEDATVFKASEKPKWDGCSGKEVEADQGEVHTQERIVATDGKPWYPEQAVRTP